jgi:hypothetical protein
MKDIERYALLGARIATAIFCTLCLLVACVTSHAETPLPVLNVSVIVDPATRDKLGETATRDWVGLMMSETAAAYAEQLGLDVRMTHLEFNHVADDTQPITLLDKLDAMRTANTLLYETGATIFFTDRRLRIGSQLYDGYAYANSVCSSFGVAVISFESGPLTTAHELGHILGAPHDGEGECKTTPRTGFIMQGSGISGTRFSQCSVDLIKKTIATTPCLQQAMPCAPAACTPPPVKKSGGGSFDELLIGFLLGIAFLAYVQRRR